MKLTVLTTAAAAALALIGASTAEAGPRFGGGSGGGGGYGGGYSGGSGYVFSQGHYDGPSHCAPAVYKVNTVEVNRYTQCRTAYDHCGRPYSYHITVVTYCDHYSNGTTRTWSQTFS